MAGAAGRSHPDTRRPGREVAAVARSNAASAAARSLRAESLVNDGTALVFYGVAVEVGHRPPRFGTGAHRAAASLLVLRAVGSPSGWLVACARGGGYVARCTTRCTENLLSVLTPFAAYLPAELLHVSGVVAVVSLPGSLIEARSARGSWVARTRVQARAFWQLTHLRAERGAVRAGRAGAADAVLRT